MSPHPSPWTLRRLHVGELPEPQAREARAHAEACLHCRGVLQGLAQEQALLESALPFERLAARVERAAARPTRAAPPRRQQWALAAAAAAVLLAVGLSPLLPGTPQPTNRLKGGAGAELRIGRQGGEQAQRVGRPEAVEPLAPGELVRLGYSAGQHRYVLAVSVDEAGEVSALYPTSGQSLPVAQGAGLHWLPEALEFSGSGHERVVVVLSGEPLEVEAVRAAARRAYEAGGRSVLAMPRLGVGGEETHWVLRKP